MTHSGRTEMVRIFLENTKHAASKRAGRREGDAPASERRRKIEHLTVNSVQSLIAAIVQLRNVNFGEQSASCTAACAKAKPFGDCKNALTRIQDGRL
jgi:hypothetical protein